MVLKTHQTTLHGSLLPSRWNCLSFLLLHSPLCARKQTQRTKSSIEKRLKSLIFSCLFAPFQLLSVFKPHQTSPHGSLMLSKWNFVTLALLHSAVGARRNTFNRQISSQEKCQPPLYSDTFFTVPTIPWCSYLTKQVYMALSYQVEKIVFFFATPLASVFQKSNPTGKFFYRKKIKFPQIFLLVRPLPTAFCVQIPSNKSTWLSLA